MMRTLLRAAIISIFFIIPTGCLTQQVGGGTATATTSTTPTLGSGTTTTTTLTSSSYGPSAVQIITLAGSGGSFDAGSVPLAGGTYNQAVRFYDLNGNSINRSSYPTWWFTGAGVFLTSTSTSFPGGGAGATTSNTSTLYQTPCAYFDSYSDNNPENSGYYTIDGLVPNAPSLSAAPAYSDVDQCAGVTAGERSKIQIYLTFNRSYMNSTDKLQLIVKAKPLNSPNTAPVPSSCVVGGLFDATACATSVFTVTMRNSVTSSARPFFMLFPSAKSLDLISENVLMPLNIDSNLTTITIDRLKGGAVIYSIILVRIQ